MAITNLSLLGATSTSTFSGISAAGATGNFPGTIGEYDEDAEISIITTEVQLTAAGIVLGSLIRIRTEPAQFIAFGTVISVAGTGTQRTVTFRIDEVQTARNADSINLLRIEVRTPGAITAATHIVGATESGFVQAIYTGNKRASNADKANLTITFGPIGDTTTYHVREGVAIPHEGTTSIISNASEREFNVLING